MDEQLAEIIHEATRGSRIRALHQLRALHASIPGAPTDLARCLPVIEWMRDATSHLATTPHGRAHLALTQAIQNVPPATKQILNDLNQLAKHADTRTPPHDARTLVDDLAHLAGWTPHERQTQGSFALVHDLAHLGQPIRIILHLRAHLGWELRTAKSCVDMLAYTHQTTLLDCWDAIDREDVDRATHELTVHAHMDPTHARDLATALVQGFASLHTIHNAQHRAPPCRST